MCKSWCEFLLGVIILVFTLWTTAASMWIVLIAAIVLIIHSFACNKCMVACDHEMAQADKSKKRKR